MYLCYRYYECEVLTEGYMKFGWAAASCDAAAEIGMDGSSFAFDGLGVWYHLNILFIPVNKS